MRQASGHAVVLDDLDIGSRQVEPAARDDAFSGDARRLRHGAL
jgi:hypothetical protein